MSLDESSVDPFVDALQKWIDIFMRRSMHQVIRYSKQCGLSMPQVGALFQIHKGGGGVSDVGDDLGVSSAAASQMLERLVQQDLVRRSEDPHDRRAKKLVLTEKGRQLMQNALHARQDWMERLVAALSVEEKAQVLTALNILIEKAGQTE